MAVIYQITNMMNGKYYIGSSASFERRVWSHKYELKNGTHKNPKLQAAWNKYGEAAFVFEILETVAEGESQLACEDRYLTGKVGLPECYNINFYAEHSRLGIPHSDESKAKISNKVQAAVAEGRGGKFLPSEETRRKMSEALKGNQCAKGHKRTPEEIEKIRERAMGNQIWLGKSHSEESIAKMSRPIVAVKPDGTKVEFTGLSAIKKEYGVALPTIIRACRSGKAVRIGVLSGWMLSYKDEEVRVEPASLPEEFAHFPKTRQLAKESGAKFYFTGEPCVRGHVAPRKTKGACTICEKEDYKKDNDRRAGKPKSEAAKKAGRRYYEQNKELMVARAKARSIMSVDNNGKTT
jgi:group I intron endonuclease